MVEIMLCPYCVEETKTGDNFCKHCGQELPGSEEIASSKPGKDTPRKLLSLEQKATRLEFNLITWGGLGLFLLAIGFIGLEDNLVTRVYYAVGNIIYYIVVIAVSVRRLNDLGIGRIWVVAAMIPFLTPFFFIAFSILPGKKT